MKYDYETLFDPAVSRLKSGNDHWIAKVQVREELRAEFLAIWKRLADR